MEYEMNGFKQTEGLKNYEKDRQTRIFMFDNYF